MPKKPIPCLPPDAASWSEDALGEYLLTSIHYNVAPAVDSVLLSRQTESCLEGIRAASALMDKADADEHARDYQQIAEWYLDEARAIVEDSLQVFFISCQIYLSRIVESLRWVAEHADAHLPNDFKDRHKILDLGLPTVPGKTMTIARAVWHLGNYSKHNMELEELNAPTRSGLIELGVMAADGTTAPEPELRGVEMLAGTQNGSFPEIEDGVRAIKVALAEWADHLIREIVIAEVDERRCGDRTLTKRRTERDREIVARFLASLRKARQPDGSKS